LKELSVTIIFDLLTALAVVFLLVVGAAMLWLVVMAIQDKIQSEDAIRRNFPVIGRFRHWFIHLGVFFRQYFFALDREEQPFNRAIRFWIYDCAKDKPGTIAFGSTNDLREPGSIIFVNSPYPTLESDEKKYTLPKVIGEHCPKPFQPQRIVNISGMSYGALSKPAVQALSHGAAKGSVWMNTGEGGLSPFHLEGNCDIVFQLGTAKFGVRDDEGKLCDHRLKAIADHEQVRAFEIKLSQGAKPGKGGILPAAKITKEIAEIRKVPMGQDARSPNRHPDISNPDELLDMIARIRDISGKPVGFKTVIGTGRIPEELIDTIARRGNEFAPDFITVDGGEGGTGAAPQVLADHMGLPLTESLEIVTTLIAEAGLRDKIRVIASGKLVTPDKVGWALAMGADYTTTARGFMMSLGCIQAMQCHKDTCPTGITTHNKRLQGGLNVKSKAEMVANYANHINGDVEMLARSCGLQSAAEFEREHVRIVQSAGRSKRLNEIYPIQPV
jgi:glutamate synthase domain-containing protein 2